MCCPEGSKLGGDFAKILSGFKLWVRIHILQGSGFGFGCKIRGVGVRR